MEGAATITIVHLSDTRFNGTPHAQGCQSQSTPAPPLHEDLTRLRDQHEIRPDLVVISGDLTAQALPAEFARAREFASALAAGLRFGSERVMIVPGDHDISWPFCKAYLLECKGLGLSPMAPYRRKWKPYTDMLRAFYAEVSGGRAFRDPVDDRVRPTFPMDEPWTLMQIPQLRVVVAGLNSTMAETHKVHRGSLGEHQIRWFARRLRWYTEQGWLRIGVLHHHPEHSGADEDPADSALFRQYLASGLNLILHGHTSEAELCRLGTEGVPVLSAGSTREGSTATTGQYQIVRVHRGGLHVMGRCYHRPQRRWIGDTRISDHGDDWRRDLEIRLRNVNAALAPLTPTQKSPTAPAGSTPPSPHDDLLARVEEICRLRAGGVAATTRVTLEPSESATADVRPPLQYLRVSHQLNGFVQMYPVGVCEHPVTPEDLEQFITRVDRPYRECDPGLVSTLVYRGNPVAESDRQAAIRRGVRLESFLDYQGVHDLGRYVTRQTLDLETDQTHYPERLYVPHRYTLVGEPGNGGRARVHSDLLGQVVAWLAEPARRFVLVLGDSGTGKSFLLRQLARRMRHDLPHVAPLLMDLRSLERTGGLDELVVSHLAASGEERVDLPKLRYLRREGRVALLFDGFDELEQRVSYDRAAEHLERLLCVVDGQAKVVLTCRTQHFLNDEQATRPIADRLEVGVRRIARLAEFDDAQIRQFHDQLAAPISTAARDRIAARLKQIRGVPLLAGLARNPRMLGFITRIPGERLEPSIPQPRSTGS
jgi:3',5'-cyclic AMP phosphodiesterase CpdA